MPLGRQWVETPWV